MCQLMNTFYPYLLFVSFFFGKHVIHKDACFCEMMCLMRISFWLFWWCRQFAARVEWIRRNVFLFQWSPNWMRPKAYKRVLFAQILNANKIDDPLTKYFVFDCLKHTYTRMHCVCVCVCVSGVSASTFEYHTIQWTIVNKIHCLFGIVKERTNWQTYREWKKVENISLSLTRHKNMCNVPTF